MKVVCIIQARMGSTRLPGKILLPLQERPVLEHVVSRMKLVDLIDEVIIATTDQAQDDILIQVCDRLNVGCFRGSEADVLNRYHSAAIRSKADIVVRITSDCPLIDPAVTRQIIAAFLAQRDAYDYVSNTLQRTYPRGLDTEVFSMAALEQAQHEAKAMPEREHVTPYIWQHPDKFGIYQVTQTPNYSAYRWTLDTLEDLALVTRVFAALYPLDPFFTQDSVLALFAQNPTLQAINAHIEQKEIGV
jgi:spore coat polysaccharide biosynthesis protein SpsF